MCVPVLATRAPSRLRQRLESSSESSSLCENKIDEVSQKWFAGVDFDIGLERPFFYTSWLSKDTRRVERDEVEDEQLEMDGSNVMKSNMSSLRWSHS